MNKPAAEVLQRGMARLGGRWMPLDQQLGQRQTAFETSGFCLGEGCGVWTATLQDPMGLCAGQEATWELVWAKKGAFRQEASTDSVSKDPA